MAHLSLSMQLLRQYGAQLAAVWLGFQLLGSVILDLAVRVGLISRIAGLAVLFLVILMQLFAFVAMFVILRDGLPALRDRDRQETPPAEPVAGRGGFLVSALLAALVPFYAYYAGWGFLKDTVRTYSQRFMDAQWAQVDFSDPSSVGPPPLEVGNSAWAILLVFAIWAIRRYAKSRSETVRNRLWPLVVVACEVSWLIMFLYALANWKQEIANWLAGLPPPQEVLDWLLPAANAAITAAEVPPVDWPPAFQPLDWLKSLLWYALLPLIWFNLGAIVYGHDLAAMAAPTQRVTGGVIDRWQRMPKVVSDFALAYWRIWFGLARRWHAVMNGFLLAASAGLAMTTSIIVLWRLADFLGRWAWIGMARLIGPHEVAIWQVLQWPLNILFGTPGQPQDGVLVVVVQFCILAAGLEFAERARLKAVTSPPAPEPG